MQLIRTIAQPPTANVAPAPMPKVLTTLRADPIVAQQAAPQNEQAAPPAQAPAPAPVEDASFAAKMFGRVGEQQNRFLYNQQLLGAISHALTERIASIGSQAWALLNGTAHKE
ncbi:MAG: hypothetical protein KDC46_06070 [Thermoleophilia bacterium]|nr:hypothetical protein [Thermoleophilia bacterium]